MTRCICQKTAHDEACPVCIACEPNIAINVKAYTDPILGGVVYLTVVRLEQEDDGSITAVVSLPNRLP